MDIDGDHHNRDESSRTGDQDKEAQVSIPTGGGLLSSRMPAPASASKIFQEFQGQGSLSKEQVRSVPASTAGRFSCVSVHQCHGCAANLHIPYIRVASVSVGEILWS
jgi:hypothetical protein